MPGHRSRSLLLPLLASLATFALLQRPVFGPAQVPPDALLPGQPAAAPAEPGASPGLLARTPLTTSILVYVLCVYIAKREPPPPAGKPPKLTPDVPPFEQRKDLKAVFLMSIVLSFVSGIVNAMAIIAMGGTVAHHTGNASHVGRLLGSDAARFAALMVAYFAGATLAGYCKADGEALYNRRYSPGMLAAAVAVAAGGVIFNSSENAVVALSLLSFSQGIQNAICRRCGSLPVCTTHMTGYLTDAGMGTGAWLLTGGKEPLATRPKFFLLSILAFVVGGTAAKLLLDLFGILSAVVPALAMGLIAYGLMPLPPPEKE